MDLKSEASFALENKHFSAAAECYSELLQRNSDNIEILSDRARAYLAMGCYENALKDSEKIIHLNPKGEEGFVLKMMSLWGLQEFAHSLHIARNQLPKPKIDFSWYEKKTLELSEQQMLGEYNMSEILRLPFNKRNFIAEFTGPVKISEAPRKGLGLYATKNIGPGKIILCSKAYAIVFGTENKWRKITGIENGRECLLLTTIARKLIWDPSTRSDFCKLSPGPRSTKDPNWLLTQCEKFPKLFVTVDRNSDAQYEINREIMNRLLTNMFNTGDEENASSGIWILPSYINHTCVNPNAIYLKVGDIMIFRALKPISIGDEITIMYASPSEIHAVFKRQMFQCDCSLCYLRGTEGLETHLAIQSTIKSIQDNLHKADEVTWKEQLERFEKLIAFRANDNNAFNILATEPVVIRLIYQLFEGKQWNLCEKLALRSWEAFRRVGIMDMALCMNTVIISCYMLKNGTHLPLLKIWKNQLEWLYEDFLWSGNCQVGCGFQTRAT